MRPVGGKITSLSWLSFSSQSVFFTSSLQDQRWDDTISWSHASPPWLCLFRQGGMSEFGWERKNIRASKIWLFKLQELPPYTTLSFGVIFFSSGVAVNALWHGPNVKTEIRKKEASPLLLYRRRRRCSTFSPKTLSWCRHVETQRRHRNQTNTQRNANMQLPRSELRVILVATTPNTPKGQGPQKQPQIMPALSLTSCY